MTLSDLANLHLIRPEWLLAIPSALWLWLRIRRAAMARTPPPKGVAPHLAAAMTIASDQKRRLLPIDGVAALAILLTLGAAGPTWSHVENPFAAQTAPLVIVLSVSDSMEKRDVAPRRLERAQHKILDVLAARSGARTALIAYAGSAHRVAPLTEDPAVLKPFLEALSPEVMPKQGDNATAALAAATAILAEEQAPGAILWLADALNPADMGAFAQRRADGGAPVIALPMTRDGAEAGSFEQAGLAIIELTADNDDVSRIERRIAQAWREARAEDDREVWDDRGWLLAWPAALLALIWFRRGWTMRWAAVIAFAVASTSVSDARADGLAGWFFTLDQRGRIAFDDKRFSDAAELFVDPAWRGQAQYRAGRYEAAAETLARVETPEAAFTAGLALIKSRQYRPAIAAFETVLERAPDFPGAARNLEIAKVILTNVELAREQSDTGEESGIGADDVVYDNEAGKGAETQTPAPSGDVAPETAEQWMRTVDTQAADFLRSRFALEAARSPPMIRAMLIVLALAAAPPVAEAQRSAQPVIKTELEDESVVPGQITVLRVTVLVQTWMPKPPEFPSFDMPNLLVRLPERSTNPVSERIDGETWSGVSRAYRLSPLTPGAISIPAQQFQITYADPETTSPIAVEVATEAVTLTGALPAGAEDLNPFIAAKELDISQKVDGATKELMLGDSLSRRVTVRVEGASPMMIPPLLTPDAPAGLGVYPSEPTLKEASDRGVVTGTRVEEATFIAEGGGRYALPALRLDWFNLKTGAIETAEAPAIEITVVGPPPAAEGLISDHRAFYPMIAVAVLSAIALYLLWRARPIFGRVIARRRAARRASEKFAFQEAKRAIGGRRFESVLNAISVWWDRIAPHGAEPPRRLQAALSSLGALNYAEQTPPDGVLEQQVWREAGDALDAARAECKSLRAVDGSAALAPLNPSLLSQTRVKNA